MTSFPCRLNHTSKHIICWFPAVVLCWLGRGFLRVWGESWRHFSMETWKQSLHSSNGWPCKLCCLYCPHCNSQLVLPMSVYSPHCCSPATYSHLSFSKMTYRIAGNFWWRKLGEKYDFHGENLHRLLPFAVPTDPMPPNFTEKTFANSHKTAKFASFLPWKFPAIWYSSTLTIPNLYSQFSNGGNDNPGEWNSLVPRLSPLRTLARRAWERLVSEHTYC